MRVGGERLHRREKKSRVVNVVCVRHIRACHRRTLLGPFVATLATIAISVEGNGERENHRLCQKRIHSSSVLEGKTPGKVEAGWMNTARLVTTEASTGEAPMGALRPLYRSRSLTGGESELPRKATQVSIERYVDGRDQDLKESFERGQTRSRC